MIRQICVPTWTAIYKGVASILKSVECTGPRHCVVDLGSLGTAVTVQARNYGTAGRRHGIQWLACWASGTYTSCLAPFFHNLC